MMVQNFHKEDIAISESTARKATDAFNRHDARVCIGLRA
jgi:hypothetical protein